MLANDLATALVTGFWIVVVEANVVGAEGTMIVGVGLVIRNRIKLLKTLAPPCIKDSQSQLILTCVIAVRLRERNAIAIVVGQAHAEAIGLDSFVRCAELSWWICADARQQTTLWITWNLVGTNGLFDSTKMMLVM